MVCLRLRHRRSLLKLCKLSCQSMCSPNYIGEKGDKCKEEKRDVLQAAHRLEKN